MKYALAPVTSIEAFSTCGSPDISACSSRGTSASELVRNCPRASGELRACRERIQFSRAAARRSSGIATSASMPSSGTVKVSRVGGPATHSLSSTASCSAANPGSLNARVVLRSRKSAPSSSNRKLEAVSS